MSINIILFLSSLGINLLMALVIRIYANPHKTIILETTLPKDKLNDPQVTAVRQAFKKRLLVIALLFSLLDLLLLVIPYDSLSLLLFMLSLFGMIGVMFYTQVTFIHKMTDVKIKNGWLLPVKPTLIDTKLILNKNRRLLKPYWLAPGIIICLGGMAYTFFVLKDEINLLIFGSISLLLLGMFLFLYYAVSRLPVKALTSDEAINQQVNDAMRHYWSVLIVSSLWVLSPIAFLPALSMTQFFETASYVMIGYFVLLFLYVSFVFFLLFSLRRTQDQLIMQASDYRYGDEDQYWRYSIYINPEDPRVFIPDRLGMNMSVNLGRPAGKAIMVALAIFLTGVLFFTTVPLLISDFSDNPFKMAVTEEATTLSAPFSSTQRIPLNKIKSVQLIDQLPNDGIRINGTATDHYLTGEFRIDNQPAYLLVYKKNSPVLKITTDNRIYYYTNKESKQTTVDFNALKKKLAP